MRQTLGGKVVPFASKYNGNHHAPANPAPHTKFNAERIEIGGAGAVATRILQGLGVQVVLMGRRTPGLIPFLEVAASEGIIDKMLPVDGPEAANVVLPESRIMRVARGPRYQATKEESDLLSELRPRAIAVGGSMDDEYVATLAEFAAVTGIWFFWNPNSLADLRVADVGCQLVLQVSFSEFANGDSSPAALARRLLVQTAASVVCVTDAENGAFGVENKLPTVRHAPAIPIAEPLRVIGAGDAHFGGFIATFLDAPKAIRLERSLTVGRLSAARHVSGLGPGDWTDLGRFQAQLDRIPVVSEAA